MRLIVDTHVLIWWVLDLPQLGPAARAKLTDETSEILFSVASPWEMAIKIGQKRLLIDIMSATRAFSEAGFRQIDIFPAHLAAVVGLERIHGDPFDRMIVAQAICEGATIMTNDSKIVRYPVRTIPCR